MGTLVWLKFHLTWSSLSFFDVYIPVFGTWTGLGSFQALSTHWHFWVAGLYEAKRKHRKQLTIMPILCSSEVSHQFASFFCPFRVSCVYFVYNIQGFQLYLGKIGEVLHFPRSFSLEMALCLHIYYLWCITELHSYILHAPKHKLNSFKHY